jgi:hypothetical protein
MWGAIIQLILGLGTAGYNAYKGKQAKNKLANMGSVDYDIPQGYADNVGLTASEAQSGYDPETLNKVLNQYSSNLAATNAAILQTGGGINDIAKGYGMYTEGVSKLALQDSALKNQKLENYLQASSTYAGQQALQWKLNKYDKDRNDRAAAQAQISGFNQGANSGLNTAVQGGMNLAQYFGNNSTNNAYQKMAKDAFQTDTNYDPNQVFMVNGFGNPPISSTQYANQNESGNAIDIGGMNNVNQIWGL